MMAGDQVDAMRLYRIFANIASIREAPDDDNQLGDHVFSADFRQGIAKIAYDLLESSGNVKSNYRTYYGIGGQKRPSLVSPCSSLLIGRLSLMNPQDVYTRYITTVGIPV